MTMTLEQLRDELDGSALGTQERHVLIVDSIEAAIRERDRLRGDVAGMTEELLHVPSRDDWRELQQRAERAEAELAEAQNTIAAQQGTMGALKRKLALAEGELAALKARIAEAPAAIMDTRVALGLCAPSESDFPALCALQGKRVRLLVDEPAEHGEE